MIYYANNKLQTAATQRGTLWLRVRFWKKSILIVFSTFRFGSSGSSQTSQTSGDFCRICHESDNINPLLTPCLCSGTLRYVHQTCLTQWLTASETNSCELCKFPFIMQSKIKPFNEVSTSSIGGDETVHEDIKLSTGT